MGPAPFTVAEAGAAFTGHHFRYAGGELLGNPATPANEAIRIAADVPASGPFILDPRDTYPALLPAGRRLPGVAEYNGRIYAVGGFDDAGLAVDTVERYDPATDTWTGLPAMPTARGGLGLVRVGDNLYAVGGDANGSAAGGKTGAVEVFGLASGTWSTSVFAAMPTSRSRFACGVDPAFGRIFAFGGEDDAGAPLNASEMYDPVTDAWTSRANVPVPVMGALGLIESGEFKLLGGEVTHPTLGSAATARILAYDPYSDAWRELDLALPYPAWGLFGCAKRVSWNQRGETQSREFCLAGGGFDGTNYRDGFFRLYTR
jgi:hypothetical protein